MNTIPAPQTLDNLLTEIACHIKHMPTGDGSRLLTEALPMLETLRTIRDDVGGFIRNNPNTTTPQ